MKTSNKILLLIAVIITALFIVFVVVLRKNVQAARLDVEVQWVYRTLSMDRFEKLDFSSHMMVRINQGKECKVEYAETDSLLRPDFKIVNGTLYMKVDSVNESKNLVSMPIKITMPSLLEIKATGGTEILLNSFQSDTIGVILENGCVFRGENNNLKLISFKTRGDALLQFKNTN